MESFLDKTPLSLYMESDLHAMHVSCGKWLFYATWIHVLLQLVSWGVGGKIEKLWKGTTGRTGVTMVICLPLIEFIALPMMVKYFKINIRYEVRKGLHYLFFAFAIALVSTFWSLIDARIICLYLFHVILIYIMCTFPVVACITLETTPCKFAYVYTICVEAVHKIQWTNYLLSLFLCGSMAGLQSWCPPYYASTSLIWYRFGYSWVPKLRPRTFKSCQLESN